MRKSLLCTSLALGCGALLGVVSFGASALPIHVGLKDAGIPVDGSYLQSWTSDVIGDPHGTVSLSGWEYDNGAWAGATMYYKNASPAETGLGVNCNEFPSGNACGEHEIGATPWQMIDMNISQLTGWQSLTINLGSVNGVGNHPGEDETGYLLGAACTVGGSCTSTVLAAAPLDSCTDFGSGHSATCSFTLTFAQLGGISDIWIASSITDQSGRNDGNILLGSDFVLNPVPEPKTLGIFGLGLLLIGAFAGLRRRRTS
ncbi:MAG: PEP-CTERM sorting domain-containing protein [Rhodanobacter sp.]